MFTYFYNGEGIILKELVPQSHTVIGKYYLASWNVYGSELFHQNHNTEK